MPFISESKLQGMTNRMHELEDRVAAMSPLMGYLTLAEAAREEVSEDLDSPMSADAIGDKAYQKMYDEFYGQLIEEKVATYTEAHKKELYEKVLQDIERSEGDALHAEVARRLETDLVVQRKIKALAREAVLTQYEERAEEEAVAAQELQLKDEAERQLQLDRLAAEYAETGRLNLQPELLTHLVEGDRMIIRVDVAKEARLVTAIDKMTFEWRQDVNQATGWIVVSHSQELKLKEKDQIVRDRFVFLGSNQQDYVLGEDVDVVGTISEDAPFVLYTKDSHDQYKATPIFLDRERFKLPNGNISSDGRLPAHIREIAFKTRGLFGE